MDETNELLIERRGNIGVLRFNRPERHNALSPQMLIQVHQALEAWARTDEVRAVVITGAGEKAFSSGYDIMAIPTDVTLEVAARIRDSNPLALALASVKDFPYPTIAMVNGHCFGGALNLALGCDLRIGADDIAVGMPAARLGVVYPCDGIAQFVQVLGMARAREVFFTARTYRGAEVRAMGLVDRLVPRSELEATTFRLAAESAGNAAGAERHQADPQPDRVLGAAFGRDASRNRSADGSRLPERGHQRSAAGVHREARPALRRALRSAAERLCSCGALGSRASRQPSSWD